MNWFWQLPINISFTFLAYRAPVSPAFCLFYKQGIFQLRISSYFLYLFSSFSGFLYKGLLLFIQVCAQMSPSLEAFPNHIFNNLHFYCILPPTYYYFIFLCVLVISNVILISLCRCLLLEFPDRI